MNKKLYTLILLVFACVMTHAQQQDVPKNANKIVVKNDKTAADNFLAVKLILAEKEIEIASQDKDINQIRTGRMSLSDNAGYSYLIFCKDGKVTISGNWSTTFGLNIGGITSAPSTYVITNKGTQKHVFNIMDEFAKKIGSDIEYLGGIDKTKRLRAEPDVKKDDVY